MDVGRLHIRLRISHMARGELLAPRHALITGVCFAAAGPMLSQCTVVEQHSVRASEKHRKWQISSDWASTFAELLGVPPPIGG